MAKRQSKTSAPADDRPAQALRTADSYQNFIARVGQGTGNQNDGGHYGFNPITRNRLQMEWVYRGSWVAGRVVDCVARDMTRKGVDIISDDDTDKIAEFNKEIARLRLWPQLCETIKWARLYGGACAFMMIDGQDPSTELRPETIRKGQFKGLLPMDRWLLNPSLQELIEDYGPDFGKPMFYQTVPDSMGMPLMMIHHSRMIRIDGVQLPYWQRISENLWGQSVLERMWDRLLAFDSTTTGVAQLVYKAHLRTLKIPNLRDYIGQGNKMMTGVLQQVNMIRAMQTNEGLTLLDKEDEFDVHNYTFSGLDNVLVQFGEQLCGAVEIPAVKMFGQSPAGFSSGDNDLRSYYDSINQNQESDLGPGVEKLYRVTYLSTFGQDTPKNWKLEFEHLWQLDEVQKSQVTKTTAESILDAYEKQVIDRATAMRELRELSNSVGTFAQIEEEAITEAENDPAPTPEALGLVAPEPEPGMPGEEGKPEKDPNEYKPNDAKPFKALDSANEVPRHEQTGKFTHGMGLEPQRFDEQGKKDDEGEWAPCPLDTVKTKSIREAIQAAHPDTCKAYGAEGEIEPWKLLSSQKTVNIKKIGEYRKDHGAPIVVVKRSGEHGIVDGHHRAVAAHLQGRTVQANIVDMDRAFGEAADHEAANPGIGILGALHLATQLRLRGNRGMKQTGTKDSFFRRLLRQLTADDFVEAQHPRDKTGKFAEKASSGLPQWKKTGKQLGSNEGGIYTDETGAQAYVKFYKNPAQGHTEVLAADLASVFGLETLHPGMIEIDGKQAVISTWQDGLSAPPWPDYVNSLHHLQRVQLAKMYYVAALTKNWDVLGLDSSNIKRNDLGGLVQTDTGGAFEFRAQGKKKPYTEHVNEELNAFLNPQYASGKVFSKLAQVDPDAFKKAAYEISKVSGADIDEAFAASHLENWQELKATFKKRYANMMMSQFPSASALVTPQVSNPVNKPGLTPLTPEQIAKLRTGARVKYQMRVAHESDGPTASSIITTVIKCPPPPLNEANQLAADEYVGSSAGINNALRHHKGDISKVGAYHKQTIEVLDEMMRNARDYSITMEVTRGIPPTVIEVLQVGDTFLDHGFSSTSFSRQKAKNFGPNTHLEIRLPKGFKFLSVPSFAKAGGMKHSKGLAMGEAEAILPRGCGFKIREIKKEHGRKVYYVDAIFSSIQPPREKWVSSLTEKREAKKAAAKATQTPPPTEGTT